jgi:hypothetical protein
MALAGGNGETGYWQGLIGAASDPYQRPLAELALALAWQKAGRFEAVFDANSPVRDDRIRELLLMRLAGADLLRRFAVDPASAPHPRQIALFTLLHKDLTQGHYADFGRDRALVPADAGNELSIWDFGTGTRCRSACSPRASGRANWPAPHWTPPPGSSRRIRPMSARGCAWASSGG